MGQPNLDAAVAQIASVEEYQQAFQRVFGRQPNGPDLLRAIASYELSRFSGERLDQRRNHSRQREPSLGDVKRTAQ